MKQDINGTRTAQDLERKYDFSSLLGLKKAVKQNKDTITKVNKELENFVVATVEGIENLQTQIDGRVTTWYYSGVPTLNNLPASEWTQDEYNVHLGDLYYDNDTGYAYRFYLDNSTNEYGWLRITDSDVTEALALANAAKDTADNKRRVFLESPIPPYDSGDLWLYNGDIYVCQISRETGDYQTDDFIIATKYTDDTMAIKVDGKLTVLSGTVTTIKESQDQFRIDLTTTNKTIDEYKREIDSNIENMSYTFGTKDLTIASSTEPVNARFNNQGMKIYTYNDLQQITNQNGVGTKN